MSAAYLRPDTLAAALQALSTGPWTIAAGCTDLFPATEQKELPGPVLDITGIAALSGIRTGPNGDLIIGATTTWREIVRADLPPALHALQRAAREVGAQQIQNRGTLAGNLCNASPAADGVPPLLAVDAAVELQSADGTRQLPLADYLTGPRQIAKRRDELLTAVHIPARALAGDSHFLKLGAREYLVISIAMTAARIVIEGGHVTDAALSVGACSPVAVRLPKIEAAMVGQPADITAIAAITDAAVAAALAPIDDVRADAPYRAHSAAELMRRTVAALVPAARGAAGAGEAAA